MSKLTFPSGKKSYGVFESFLSAIIFFSPNFLMLFDTMLKTLWIFLLYNFIIMFMMTSTIANIKFK